MSQVTRLATSVALPLAAAISLMAWVDKATASVLARRNWWAFRKPVRPPVPDASGDWARTPVDAFILEGLRSKKLAPSTPLARERLLRRVTLDRTGLPPEPGHIDLFLRDASPGAYVTVVDRLLA